MSRQPAAFSSSGYRSGARPVPVSTTSQPARASSTAIGRPIDRMRPAPVTTATLPSKPVSVIPAMRPSSAGSSRLYDGVMRRTIFDDEHEQFRSAFRQFLDKEVVPRFDEWEQAGVVDRAVYRK